MGGKPLRGFPRQGLGGLDLEAGDAPGPLHQAVDAHGAAVVEEGAVGAVGGGKPHGFDQAGVVLQGHEGHRCRAAPVVGRDLFAGHHQAGDGQQAGIRQARQVLGSPGIGPGGELDRVVFGADAEGPVPVKGPGEGFRQVRDRRVLPFRGQDCPLGAGGIDHAPGSGVRARVSASHRTWPRWRSGRRSSRAPTSAKERRTRAVRPVRRRKSPRPAKGRAVRSRRIVSARRAETWGTRCRPRRRAAGPSGAVRQTLWRTLGPRIPTPRRRASST